MFEGFTEASIKAVMLAQEETRRLRHDKVGSETLLLGLIGARGLAAQALKSINVSLEQARREVELLIGRGPGSQILDISFTPRVKRIFELSWSITREVEGHQNFLSTKYLLLGLIDESQIQKPGPGIIALLNCEADLPALRQKTLSLSNDLAILDMPCANDPRTEDPPPFKSDPWPPNNDPDDRSRVPLRPKPSDGAGEIALPLPKPDNLDS